MRYVILFTGGRSGSKLLHSLFDNHPEIANFPGIFKFSKDTIKMFEIKDPKKFVEKFIDLNPEFFDSRLNKIHRQNKLGKNKNKFYVVNKKLFKSKFISYFKKTKKKNIDRLKFLHLAYMYVNNSKIKPKIILLHLHLFETFSNYLQTFKVNKKTKILIMYRDPIISMCSTIKNWLKYDQGRHMTPRAIYANYQSHFNIFNNLKNYKNLTRVVKLENLHTKGKKTMKKICKFIGIKFNRNLLKSTFMNMAWWGDSVSKKYISGLNPNFKNNFDKKIFLTQELIFIENRIIEILLKYKYPIRSTILLKEKKNFYKLFEFEKKFYKINLGKFKLKTKLSIIFFYLKRVMFFYKNFPKYNLPEEI